MKPPAAADNNPGPHPSPLDIGAAGAAAGARRRVIELLNAAGIALDGIAAADALLVTSELVANAIRHGGGITAFHATLDGNTLRLAVSDANPHHPTRRPTPHGQPGGYGWPLIQRLTEHITITPLPAGGKTITAVQYLVTNRA
ncbi:ATP-binding protein [Streptomyces sp. NPDC058623]|uniref:ATP-binding protein n=1 Tax=Streptomyces sp. NPDC058623 TaxID=3346563 RepID=UPI00366856C6